MKSVPLLERFDDIANLSALMLAAAREDNWPEVARLKDHVGIVIDEVRVLSITVALSAEERRVKLAFMQQILANDGQLQELSQPWLRHVARWLHAGGPATGQFEGMLR
jgi:flagellar protein FliT